MLRLGVFRNTNKDNWLRLMDSVTASREFNRFNLGLRLISHLSTAPNEITAPVNQESLICERSEFDMILVQSTMPRAGLRGQAAAQSEKLAKSEKKVDRMGLRR